MNVLLATTTTAMLTPSVTTKMVPTLAHVEMVIPELVIKESVKVNMVPLIYQNIINIDILRFCQNKTT